MEHRRNIVEDLAVTLAVTFPGLNADELREWFEQLFADAPDTIETWEAFREAYAGRENRDATFTPPPVWLEEVAGDGFACVGAITLGFTSGRGLQLVDMNIELF